MMKIRIPTALCACVLVASLIPTPATADMAPFVRQYLNELSDRRRLNTLFPNPQSPMRGVQVEYVNVGVGNLTFRVRDLVVRAANPIVVGRVYDSSGSHTEDFGPGWKVNLTEWFETTDSGASFVSNTGQRFDLTWRPDGTAQTVSPTPGVDALRIVRIGDRIELAHPSGWQKRFDRDGDRYLLSEATSPHGLTTVYGYTAGALSSVKNSFGAVFITRRDDGRVIRVADDMNRTVRFLYDDAGRLTGTVSFGGSNWGYEYDTRDRLNAIVDPAGNAAMSVEFDPAGRARQIDIGGRRHRYDYRGLQTLVTRGNGTPTAFEHESSGLPRSVTSALGVTTTLGYDEQLRPKRVDRALSAPPRGVSQTFASDLDAELSAVLRPLGALATDIRYDHEGRVSKIGRTFIDRQSTIDYEYTDATMTSLTSEGEVERFEFGTADEVTTHQADGMLRRFSFSATGRPVTVDRDDGHRTIFSYEPRRGLIQRVDFGEEKWTSIARDELGRLTGVQYSSGNRATISYGPDDFRSGLRWNERLSERFRYDGRGNLQTIVTSLGKSVFETLYDIDEDNRLRGLLLDGERYQVAYGDQGEPTSVVDPQGNRLDFGYDDAGRPDEVRRNGTLVAKHDYGLMEPDLRDQLDERTGQTTPRADFLQGDHGSMFELVYARSGGFRHGVLLFDADLGTVRTVAPDWRGSHRYLTFVAGLSRIALGEDSDEHTFIKPSNAMFIPPEMANVNCCMTLSQPDPTLTPDDDDAWPTCPGIEIALKSTSRLGRPEVMWGSFPVTQNQQVRIDFHTWLRERYQIATISFNGVVQGKEIWTRSSSYGFSADVPPALRFDRVSALAARHRFTGTGRTRMTWEPDASVASSRDLNALATVTSKYTFGREVTGYAQTDQLGLSAGASGPVNFPVPSLCGTNGLCNQEIDTKLTF